MDSYLRRKYETSIRDIEAVRKEDLDLVGGAWQKRQMKNAGFLTIFLTHVWPAAPVAESSCAATVMGCGAEEYF